MFFIGYDASQLSNHHTAFILFPFSRFYDWSIYSIVFYKMNVLIVFGCVCQ